MAKIVLREDFIKLGQALKAAKLVGSGVEAKIVILDGKVKVNGQVELQHLRCQIFEITIYRNYLFIMASTFFMGITRRERQISLRAFIFV